ncbi:hypothetical protein QBC46DRAFT_355918 [Diplogelasinospora grovesii]|uniref:DUF4211 domain-containing protein n=1 Tax=Diplogelasinospora grovesii TaxID=303347 RepID=A0AAN6S382_9PEZI|nr:hypothetical protein QBC46DRAFT_355918 [Diplogelasinospora grovesii]
MPRAKLAKQQTLEATLGRPKVKEAVKTRKTGSSTAAETSSPRQQPPSSSSFVTTSPAGAGPSSSFMPSSAGRRRVRVLQSSSDSEDDDAPVGLPVRSPQKRKRQQILDDDQASEDADKNQATNDEPEDEHKDSDEDSDDLPLVTPKSAKRGPIKAKRHLVHDSDEEDLREAVSSPTKRRRLVARKKGLSPVTSDDEDQETPPAKAPSFPIKKARRKPLTQKEKAREVLRRKRAGELNKSSEAEMSDEEEEEEEEPKKALYDTDSEHEVLREFDDDDEGVIDYFKEKPRQSSPFKKKSDNGEDQGEEEEDDMDDFIVEDERIGAPDLGDELKGVPIQFTSHSHKPLKEHFKDAVEWLVQRKINPGFVERTHELYCMAWQKLDDRVTALAQSKFSSAIWKKGFLMALRARPQYTTQEIARGSRGLRDEVCGACGKTGHPTRYVISFQGPAYNKKFYAPGGFLEPIEPASGSDDDEEDVEDIDEDGNPIPKETTVWNIGSVCNANAEIAHNLMHWKYALLDWVDTSLDKDKYMTPEALAERAKWSPKKKYKLVDEILADWTKKGIIRALYNDFDSTINAAENYKPKDRRGLMGR